jgi:hypothetical protein
MEIMLMVGRVALATLFIVAPGILLPFQTVFDV